MTVRTDAPHVTYDSILKANYIYQVGNQLMRDDIRDDTIRSRVYVSIEGKKIHHSFSTVRSTTLSLLHSFQSPDLAHELRVAWNLRLNEFWYE
jgi:hypothetical protein